MKECTKCIRVHLTNISVNSAKYQSESVCVSISVKTRIKDVWLELANICLSIIYYAQWVDLYMFVVFVCTTRITSLPSHWQFQTARFTQLVSGLPASAEQTWKWVPCRTAARQYIKTLLPDCFIVYHIHTGTLSNNERSQQEKGEDFTVNFRRWHW